MLGEVVTEVVKATAPVNVELALVDAIFYPVKSHVDGFGATLLDGVVDDAGGAGVVDLDGSGTLWMPHFFKGSAERNGVLRIEK